MKEPIRDSIKAKGHTPIYSVHRYFARRPHNVFRNLINYYLDKPGVILDPFLGGGVSAIEGLTAGHRTVGFEINPVASFINQAQLTSIDIELLEKEVLRCLSECSQHVGFTYQYKDQDVFWYRWQSITECPHCSSRMPLNENTTRGNGIYVCSTCDSTHRPKRISKNSIEPVDLCLVKGELDKYETTVYKVDIEEIRRHHKIISEKIQRSEYYLKDDSKTPIPKCNLEKESSLHKKDFLYFEDFISEKNQAWIISFANSIQRSKFEQLKIPLFYILSASLRYISRFSSLNHEWRKNNKPLEWAKSNFWTPYSFVEFNPAVAIKERFNAVKSAQKDYKARFPTPVIKSSVTDVLNSKADFAIVNEPSQNLSKLPEESVDLIVTDPPYGTYLNYGELTGFWHCWLNKYLPDMFPKKVVNEKEAIASRKKHEECYKSFASYEYELTDIFKGAYRALKDESYMVFTFNNKEPEAWIALLRAVKKANFILPEGGIIFQDGVDNYKRTIALRRDGAIHGDFIYSFYKSKKTIYKSNAVRELNWKNIVLDLISEWDFPQEEVSNTDLYLAINNTLLPKLYEYINPNKDIDANLETFNFKNLESLLYMNLAFEGGVWSRKKT